MYFELLNLIINNPKYLGVIDNAEFLDENTPPF